MTSITTAYIKLFDEFQIQQRKSVIALRLQKALGISIHQFSEDLSSADHDKVKEAIQALKDNTGVKVSVIFCPKEEDTILTGLAIEEELLRQQPFIPSLSIDCGRFHKHISQCVQLALDELQFQSSDTDEIRKSKVILLLTNYDQLGTYENVFVKNQLATWKNLQMIVTCRRDYFQHRGIPSFFIVFGNPTLIAFSILGFESCFLPDPTNLDLSAIKSYDIGLLASELKAIRCGRRSTINPEHFRRQEQPLSITAKRKAQLWELNEFLKTVKNVNGLFRGNPQVFISYAWEESNTPEGKKSLARQQSHLRQLAHDLTTLGFPTWLDVERLLGNIDEQMAGNIESSSFAIVICTPRYANRAKAETNVRKEFCKIMQKQFEEKSLCFLSSFLVTIIMLFQKN